MRTLEGCLLQPFRGEFLLKWKCNITKNGTFKNKISKLNSIFESQITTTQRVQNNGVSNCDACDSFICHITRCASGASHLLCIPVVKHPGSLRKTRGTATMCEDRPLVFFQPWKPEIETSDTMENRSYLRLLFQVTCLSYWTSRILMKAYESGLLEKFQCPCHVTFLQMPTKYNQNRNLQIHIPRPQILSVTSCCMLLGEHKAGRASNLKKSGPNWTPIVTI